MSERRRQRLREFVLEASALAAVLLAVFWRPIVRYGTHTFAPVDLPTQSTSLTRFDEHHTVSNNLLPDPVVQMHPWELFDREELAAGRAPLWNPYNACGVPHLANYQSAPFSPFTWPFYVLPFKAALIVASFAKLFALALFTALFLHQIGCARFASLWGALAFATSGFALLLHQYPHVGAMLVVPGGLYFAERALQELEDGKPRISLASFVGLAIVLAVAALAGHPETLSYGLLVLGAYCVWRVVGLYARNAVPRARIVRVALALVAVGFLGGALAAVQLVPFAEYLSHSASAIARSGAKLPLARDNWPLLLFPNLAGTPVDSRTLSIGLPKPNYEEFTTFYVGGVVLLLAVAGLVFARRDRRTLFFALSALVWAIYAWDVFGLATWLGHNTPLGLVPIHRTQPLWTPAACVLAAVALDRIERATIPRRGLAALATLAVGGLVLFVFHHGARSYFERVIGELGLANAELKYVEAHVHDLMHAIMVGVAGIALCFLARNAFTKYAGRVLVLGAMLFESAWVLGGYVPTVEDRFTYPHAPAIDALRERVGSERVVVLSRDSLRPDVNLVYGISLLTNYDALDIAEYQRLFKHFFGGPDTLRASKRGLELFGVTYVATKTDWLPIDTELADVIVERYDASAYLLSELQLDRPSKPLAEVTRDEPWRFQFEATRDNFDALCLQLLDEPAAREHRVAWTLRDLTSDKLVCDSVVAAKQVKSFARLPGGRVELVVEFATVGETRDHAFELELRSPDATTDAPLEIARGGKGKGYRPHGSQGERESGPALDLAYGSFDFGKIALAGEHRLRRYERSRGRAWIVTGAVTAPTPERAFELVTAPEFDPYTSVVLENATGVTGSPTNPSKVELLAETPTSQRWRAASSDGGWFVLAQTWFPGWKARVDGVATPVLRANYAFSAVALPAGEHEVELVYEPASFRIGVIISLASALLGVAAFVFAKRATLRGP